MEFGFGVGVGTRLKACVAYVFLVLEAVLLGEVEAAFVACVRYVHWEGYLLEGFAAVVYTPGDPD